MLSAEGEIRHDALYGAAMVEMRRGALSIVEGASDLDCSDADWLRQVTTVIARDISGPLGTIGYFYHRYSAGYSTGLAHVAGGDSSLVATTQEVLRHFPTWDLERFFRAPGLRTSSEVCTTCMPENPYGVLDFRGIVIGDGVHGVTIGAPLVNSAFIHDSTRRRWFAICRSLTTVLRLRDIVGGERAVEMLAHNESGAVEASLPQVLRPTSVRAIRRLLGVVRECGTPTELPLWRELTSGRWTLIEPFDGTQTRAVCAHANSHDAMALRALTPSENLLVRYLLAGVRPAAAAQRLDISRAAASQLMYQVLAKLRVRSVAALTLLASALRGRAAYCATLDGVQVCAAITETPSLVCRERLSPSEIEIARYLLRGMSLAQVAARRGRAVRTVANQVASLYKKLGVNSRVELGLCIHRLGLDRGLGASDESAG